MGSMADHDESMTAATRQSMLGFDPDGGAFEGGGFGAGVDVGFDEDVGFGVEHGDYAGADVTGDDFDVFHAAGFSFYFDALTVF